MVVREYFTELTVTKGFIYTTTVIFFVSVSLISLIEPLISLPCKDIMSTVKHKNPEYIFSNCRHTRFVQLLFMTPFDCDLGRRLLMAVILGAIIGFERRQADRPAGIRTMSLVALGSALFTVTSSYAFQSGPMAWDAARVSAAIPSGVGFLGAGMIFQNAQKDQETGEDRHVVIGITTAASTWLSAAVGVACGGKLFFVATYTSFLMIVLLRFAPRAIHIPEDEEPHFGSFGADKKNVDVLPDDSPAPGETTPLKSPWKTSSAVSPSSSSSSFRQRSSLAASLSTAV